MRTRSVDCEHLWSLCAFRQRLTAARAFASIDHITYLLFRENVVNVCAANAVAVVATAADKRWVEMFELE